MSYQSTPEDRRRAYLLGGVYIVLAIILGLMLFKIWPPVPWPAPKDDAENQKLAAYLTESGCPPQPTPSPCPGCPTTSPDVDRSGDIITIPIRLYGNKCVGTTFDERLLLLVIVAGILGAFVHGATSLADYIGNNNFNRTWTWFYVLRPAIGMALALVFYFVIRGGFLTTSGGAKDRAA